MAEEQEPRKEVTKNIVEKQQASKSVVTKIPKNMTEMSDMDMLATMLSIYSPSGDEHAMIAYVTQYLRDAGIDYEIDTAGNIYFSNHVEGNNRILLNAHMDTVGSGAPDIFWEKQKKGTVLYSTNNQVIGGDDKCGVFAVLKLITNKAQTTPLSGLLCVAEETGCNGAKHAMEHHSDKFKDVVFNITIDRRGNTDIITENCDYQLCSKEVEKMLDEWGKPFKLESTSGSISDVSEIIYNLNINGINLFAGYYNAHSGSEYIVMEHLYESMAFIQHIVPKLHQHFKQNPDKVEYQAKSAFGGWGGAYTVYGGSHYENYNGVKYYSGVDNKWSSEKPKSTAPKKSYATTDADDDEYDEFLDAMVLFYEVMSHIEQQEGNFADLDRIAQDEGTRVSKTGKSVVIPDAFANYYLELDILEDYLSISQNDYDAVIPISELKAFAVQWGLDKGDSFLV